MFMPEYRSVGDKVFGLQKQKIYIKGKFFFNICRVFAMKSVQNLKSFWCSSQNYFVLALFCSLHS